MTIVITGIGGLLGGELAAQARRLGHRVIGLTRRPDPTRAGLADELVIEDLAAGTRPDWHWVAGEAVVFHLAADTQIYGPGDGFQRDNVCATISACEIARQTGGRLVFFSSSAVYAGRGTSYPVTVLKECADTNPATAYGRSKKAAEEYIAQTGMAAIVLRLFGVLSERLAARPPRGNLVQAIMNSLGTGEELTLGLDAAGRPGVRDYVLDEDICRLALQAGEMLTSGNSMSLGTQTLNLCTGVPTSTRDLAELAQAVTGRKFGLRFTRRHSEENEVMVGDVTALRRALGFVPRSRIREFWERVGAVVSAPGPMPER